MGTAAAAVTASRAQAAMAAMGFGENYLRLPLTCMEPEHEKVLLDIMRGHGLIG